MQLFFSLHLPLNLFHLFHRGNILFYLTKKILVSRLIHEQHKMRRKKIRSFLSNFAEQKYFFANSKKNDYYLKVEGQVKTIFPGLFFCVSPPKYVSSLFFNGKVIRASGKKKTYKLSKKKKKTFEHNRSFSLGLI